MFQHRWWGFDPHERLRLLSNVPSFDVEIELYPTILSFRHRCGRLDVLE